MNSPAVLESERLPQAVPTVRSAVLNVRKAAVANMTIITRKQLIRPTRIPLGDSPKGGNAVPFFRGAFLFRTPKGEGEFRFFNLLNLLCSVE